MTQWLLLAIQIVKISVGFFFAPSKKAQWYLTRGLAKQLGDDSIGLKFQPKGLGHHGDKYHLEEKMNICVCCGASQDLTMHHVGRWYY